MRYIITYRLRRKNARRKMYSKFDAENEVEARKHFDSYIQYRKRTEDTSKQLWELLTGDWQHVCFWCESCKRNTTEMCNICGAYEIMKGIGKKNEKQS